MTSATVGILSTGDMGHAVGGALRGGGLRVVTCLAGRGERTRALADAAGIEDVPSLEDLAATSDALLSILVPSAALAAAERVAAALRATGAQLLYADCNAIAPRTVRTVAEAVTAAGARFADVGIIGSPPRGPHPGTRFYASGPGAEEFATLAAHGLDARVLGAEIGQASGFKMCYGALTKGLQALGVELLVAAKALGLEDALQAEQEGSVAEVRAWLERAVPAMPPKAHRWVGEMEEIAACFADVGLTPRLFEGVADLYRFVAATAIGHESPETRDRSRDLRGVVAALAAELPEGASSAT